MNVSLTKKLEQLVNKKVRSGRYGSASEVVREALRLLEREDELRDIQKAELRRAIEQGVAELDRRQSVPGPEAFAKVRRKIAQRRKRG